MVHDFEANEHSSSMILWPMVTHQPMSKHWPQNYGWWVLIGHRTWGRWALIGHKNWAPWVLFIHNFEDAQHSSALFLTQLLPLTIVMLNTCMGVFSNHPNWHTRMLSIIISDPHLPQVTLQTEKQCYNHNTTKCFHPCQILHGVHEIYHGAVTILLTNITILVIMTKPLFLDKCLK